MADNFIANAGAGGDTFGADDVGGVKFPRSKLIFGADGTNDGDVDAANPLPVTISGVATSAKQDTIIVDTGVIAGDTTSIDGKITACNTGAVVVASSALPTGAASAANQATIITDTGVIAGDTTSLDAKAPALGTAIMTGSTPVTVATDDTQFAALIADTGNMDTNLNTIAGDTTSVDTKTPALGTAIMTGSVPTTIATDDTQFAALIADTGSMDTNLGTIAGDTTSLDGKVTACNTGAVVLAAGTAEYGKLAAGVAEIGNVKNSGTFAVQSTLQAGTAAFGKLSANSGVDIGDVDVTSISAGTNLVGDVGLSGARTSGGTTFYKNLDVDESEDQIKATAGQLYWIHGINLAATKIYLKFYNATAATVVVGTTVPDLTFPLPTQGDTNGAGFTLSIPNGIAFGTAITVAATTGFADADSGAPAANTVILNLGYA